MTSDRSALLSCWPGIFPRPVVALSCGDGWLGLIDALCDRLQAAAAAGRIAQPVAAQVKEKFAGLRVYTVARAPLELAYCADAEALSLTVCEACGGPGRVRFDGGGWWATRCDACAPAGTKIYEPAPGDRAPHAYTTDLKAAYEVRR